MARAVLAEGLHADGRALPEGPEVSVGPHPEPGQLLRAAPWQCWRLRRLRRPRAIWAPRLLPAGAVAAPAPAGERALRPGLAQGAARGLPGRAAGPAAARPRARLEPRGVGRRGHHARARGPLGARGPHRRRRGDGRVLQPPGLAPGLRHQGPQATGPRGARPARGRGQRGSGGRPRQLPHLPQGHQLPGPHDVAGLRRHGLRGRASGAGVPPVLHAARGRVLRGHRLRRRLGVHRLRKGRGAVCQEAAAEGSSGDGALPDRGQ
mmetsp:Transcript_79930/g.226096  ORF Transcript_79930/g.226096 Transcript_79930/m.226096 type:complete len:264 (-) Transcript_79930:426-1217(-)